MSSSQLTVKEAMLRGLKETIHAGSGTFPTEKNSIMNSYSQSNENEMIVSKHFSKSIKTFLEHSLFTELKNHSILQNQDINKETWKIDAYNLTKTLLTNESKLSYINENLSNILDSCLKEFDETGLQNASDSDIDVSPLLLPEHIMEIAECVSVEKPPDVRVNALRVLCKSHFTDIVSGEGWLLLQKKLVDNLSDSNTDIFMMCLKAHAKLASCSSPEAIKECSLNLMESLSRHYCLQEGECQTTTFQNKQFYRKVYLVFLLLHTFKEATTNVARFGESKLQEMIENFIQLMSINVSSKSAKNKSFNSPLEIVALLDPYAKWVLNFTHFNLSRQLFFSTIYKNLSFVRICAEEILGWLSEPVIPSANSSKISEGEINVAIHKYSLFCHCLATLTTICSYGISTSLFPISISKKADLISVKDILDVFITSINDSQFSDTIVMRATPSFRSFLALNLAKTLCFKHLNGYSFMLKLLRANEGGDPLLSPLKIEILFIISNTCESNNPLVQNDASLRKKQSLFSHCFTSNTSSSNQRHGSTRQMRETDNQGPQGDGDTSPFDIYLKIVLETAKLGELKNYPELIVIMTNMFRNFEIILGVQYDLRTQITQVVGEVYTNLQSSVDVIVTNLSHTCTQFLLQCALSPLGFYTLQKLGLVNRILRDELQMPEPNWSNYVWLNFIAKVSEFEEGFSVLVSESDNILKKELMQLWNTIEEDVSGSELPVKEHTNYLLRIITLLTLNIKGTKALLNEEEDGSEITLTDETDTEPSNLLNLIKNFALNYSSCPDFIHHQFALTVLDIVVSNIDISVYLLNKFNFQELLLQLQADNRVDDNSDVIIDECSLLRQKIVEKTYLPGRLLGNMKPTHAFPRPDSTLTRTKPRSRGNGELARWLSETRPGLHDHSWLKHARKLYRNSSPDEIKGAIIVDLLEQVLKVLPDSKSAIKWSQEVDGSCTLMPEEDLAVQLAVRYGAHHRIFQGTQANIDNLSQLILIVKTSFNIRSDDFKGFDWFVASSFLICSGSIEKAQAFMSLLSTLPTTCLLWSHFGKASTLAQLGNVLETMVSEEMPALFQVLQRNGLSWWQLCRGWMERCWWGVLDWPLICHWFMTAILYQPDQLLYFCAALLHSNHDRLLRMASEETVYEIVVNPAEKFQLIDARTFIDKLQKKYHGTLHPHLASL